MGTLPTTLPKLHPTKPDPLRLHKLRHRLRTTRSSIRVQYRSHPEPCNGLYQRHRHTSRSTSRSQHRIFQLHISTHSITTTTQLLRPGQEPPGMLRIVEFCQRPYFEQNHLRECGRSD